jgi:hypothetical protein
MFLEPLAHFVVISFTTTSVFVPSGGGVSSPTRAVDTLATVLASVSETNGYHLPQQPPGHSLAAEKVRVEVSRGAPRDIKADAYHPNEVDDEDNDIQTTEFHSLLSARCQGTGGRGPH